MTKGDWNEYQRTAAGLRSLAACDEVGDIADGALELAEQIEDWLEGVEPEADQDAGD